MGNFHKDFPEEVQKSRRRGQCRICGKKKYVKFLYRMRRGMYGPLCQWECIDKTDCL